MEIHKLGANGLARTLAAAACAVVLGALTSSCDRSQTRAEALRRICAEVPECDGCDAEAAWTKAGRMVERSRPPARTAPITNPEVIAMFSAISGAPIADRLRVFREELASEGIPNEDCPLVDYLEAAPPNDDVP